MDASFQLFKLVLYAHYYRHHEENKQKALQFIKDLLTSTRDANAKGGLDEERNKPGDDGNGGMNMKTGENVLFRWVNIYTFPSKSKIKMINRDEKNERRGFVMGDRCGFISSLSLLEDQCSTKSLPIHWVSILGLHDIASLFLEHARNEHDDGRMIDAAERMISHVCHGNDALSLAVDNGHIDLVRLYLMEVPDCAVTENMKKKNHHHSLILRHHPYPLHIAIAYGRTAIELNTILSTYPSFHTKLLNHQEQSLMHIAAKYHDRPTNTSTSATASDSSSARTRKHETEDYANDELLSFLLQLDRNAPSSQDKDGRVPIHISVQNGNIYMTSFLLQHLPSTASFADRNGNLPLHMVQEEVHIARELLEKYPTAAATLNHNGLPPLACTFSKSIVDMLLKICPDACHMACLSNGEVPLHGAVRYGCLEVVQLILEQSPDMACVKNKRGLTPLHVAIQDSCEDLDRNYLDHDAIVEAIVRICPSACLIANGGVETSYPEQPMDTKPPPRKRKIMPSRIGYTKNCVFVEQQTQIHSDSTSSYVDIPQKTENRSYIRQEIAEGQLPLHLAVSKGKVAMTHLLLQHGQFDTRPSSAARIFDKNGSLPIHCCVSTPDILPANRVRILHLLVRAYPDALLIKDRVSGRLPIHYTIKDCRDTESFQMLFEKNFQQGMIRDKDRMTPLDIAISCNSKAALHIVKRCPAAVSLRNRKGDLPLHQALRQKRHHMDINILHELLHAYPLATTIRDSNQYLPLHLSLKMIKDEDGLIERILHLNPNATKIVDPQNFRLPLHIAITSRRFYIIKAILNMNMNALGVVDSLLGLYPYQMAALPIDRKHLNSTEPTPLEQLSSVYDLLALKPSVIIHEEVQDMKNKYKTI